MRAIAALMLVATAMAGCSDGAPPADVDDGTYDGFEKPPVTDDTGLIRGVVVSEAIVPLAGATVTIQQTQQEVKTNENGAFLFGGLEAGSYLLRVHALGYETVQSSVQVEAGVAEPPVVRILLPADPSGMPYHKDHHFTGFIWCGLNYVAVCGGLRDFAGFGDDTYSELYDTDRDITHLQSEMFWQNTQRLGDSFSVAHRFATQEQFDGGFYEDGLTSGSGPSPLLVVTDAEKYNKNSVGEDYEFLISIFAGQSVTAPGTAYGLGAAVEQDYEMFIHEFHGYTPPEGWRFSEDPVVPEPA